MPSWLVLGPAVWIAATVIGIALLVWVHVREERRLADDDELAARRAAHNERAARAALAPPRNVIPLPVRRRR